MPETLWKYTAIAQVGNCPPPRIERREVLAYRFVHKDPTDSRSFLPVAMIPSGRLPGSVPCCTEYSLSFFSTQEKAIERLKHLAAQQSAFADRAGGCVAAVQISANDGASTKPSKKTQHFELFEFADADLSKKIVGDLMEVIQCST